MTNQWSFGNWQVDCCNWSSAVFYVSLSSEQIQQHSFAWLDLSHHSCPAWLLVTCIFNSCGRVKITAVMITLIKLHDWGCWLSDFPNSSVATGPAIHLLCVNTTITTCNEIFPEIPTFVTLIAPVSFSHLFALPASGGQSSSQGHPVCSLRLIVIFNISIWPPLLSPSLPAISSTKRVFKFL